MTTPDTPPLTDLIGLDPDFTGVLSPEEHLRRQRCGECDEAEAALAAVTAERDAYRKAKAENDERFQLAAAREQAKQAQAELAQVAVTTPEAVAVISAAMDAVTEIKANFSDAATNAWLQPYTRALVGAVDAFATPAAAPQADEPGPVVWCNRCRELISPNRVAEHNASDAHRSREPKPLPAAAPDPAPTWRGMPIKACGFPRSHTNHVYDDGAGKTVCIGPLHATVTAPVPAGGETTTPATRCCPNHREPGEARYGCATAPGVTDPCCNECHYWVAWTRYLDGHDDEDAEPVPAGGEDGSGTADGGVLSLADSRRITDAIWGGGVTA